MISRPPATAAAQVRRHSGTPFPSPHRCLQVGRHVHEADEMNGVGSVRAAVASGTAARCRGNRRRRSRCSTGSRRASAVRRCARPAAWPLARQGRWRCTASPLGMLARSHRGGRRAGCGRRARSGSLPLHARRRSAEPAPPRRRPKAAPAPAGRGSTRRAELRRSPHARGTLRAPPRSAPGSARPSHCCRRPGRGRSR